MICGWWNRWWHRRLRRLDRQFMIPLLLGAPVPRETRAAAVTAFMCDAGQEHWVCACSDAEAAALLEATIAADEDP